MSESTTQLPDENVLAETREVNLSEYLSDWLRRLRSGDIGSLPIIVGLIVIALVFGSQNPLFFNERNFVNLLLQTSGLTAIAIGVVFVLLIAEIDLSVAYVGGVGAVIMTLLLRENFSAWPWWASVFVALLATSLIGLLHGFIITKARVPSFVVTLAGLLAWSGVVLILTTQYSTAGTIIIQNSVIVGIANAFIPALWGWVVGIIAVGSFVASRLLRRQRLQAQGLADTPLAVLAVQLVGVTAIVTFVIWYANRDRGLPVVAVIILVLLVFWSYVASRTPFGRYVYAVGGNPEAARRAGINVERIRIYVFMISSFMAGVGGIILASRLRSVDTNIGGGNLLLNAIAAAVIGGTSLFGGTGTVISALLGALIIQSVENGMGLLGLPSGVKFVVNGLVLLAAVLIDAFSRRSRAASGIA